MVASIVACSATVSDAWPSAMPDSLLIAESPESTVSTPNSPAMFTTFAPFGPAT
jgi:hypothetical protein